ALMPTKSDAPLQFQLRKLGHVVLNVTDLERSVRFYTEVLGLAISDRYPDSMVPGGMVFMRCNADHHGVALVGGARKSDPSSLNHFAFVVATLDEVFRARAWLCKHGVPIVLGGRRALPSLNLIGQSLLAGLFTGGLYALLGLGLSLTWGLLRVINLANFALAFLGAYLTYQLATALRLDPILTLVVIVPGFFVI